MARHFHFAVSAISAHPPADMAMIMARNVRDGSFHSHRDRPATTAASTIRSTSASSRAPREVEAPRRRAVSPSTPSSTDAAWVRRPPTTARPADSDQAAMIPTTKNSADSRSGWIRSGAMAMVIRVEIGRLRCLDTGPSVGFPRERRTSELASSRSSGVSTSCHQSPSDRGMAFSG